MRSRSARTLVVVTATLALLPLMLLALGGGVAVERAQACSPYASPASPASASGSLIVAHANIKVSLPADAFQQDLEAVVNTGADLVSLNEVARRTDAQITPDGYAAWRVPDHGDDGTAVLWRTDRWSLLDRGRVILVSEGPQRWDYDRAATWATLGDNDGLLTSLVSVHHMVNPAKVGPNKPLRQQLYREGMEKVQTLVATLSARGTVFVAGDFNSQYTANDPWGPRAMLGAIGMRSTMDTLGHEPTHDGGGIIDYVFYQPQLVNPTSQRTAPLRSDHRLLVATFATQENVATTSLTDNDPSVTSAAPGYTAEQVNNAAAIIAAGHEIGITPRGQAIALMTAMGESDLRVLDHGDAAGPDSRGLFQQRDNGAWGTLEDRMDPRRSSLMFYRALLRVPAWQTLEPTLAAHAVQRNTDPRYYTQFWAPALQLLTELAGSAAGLGAAQTGTWPTCIGNQASTAMPLGAVIYPLAAALIGSNLDNYGDTGPNWSAYHTGTDFSVPCGTTVYAAHAGTVEIDRTQAWAGPQLVKVNTGPSRVTTWYAHMQQVTVQAGDIVGPGRPLGEVGAEGNTTGCHLHFEVHPNNGDIYEDDTDPTLWLEMHAQQP